MLGTELVPKSDQAHMDLVVHIRNLLSKIPQGALTEFHLFKKLPQELRLNIWNLALPNPRFVDLCFEGNTSVPGILQACQESRLEVRRSLRVIEVCICMATNHRSRTYVNIIADTIAIRECLIETIYPSLSDISLLRYFRKFATAKVRHIFISGRFWDRTLTNRCYQEELEGMFRNGALESVVVDCRSEEDQWLNDLTTITYRSPDEIDLHTKLLELLKRSGCGWKGRMLYAA